MQIKYRMPSYVWISDILLFKKSLFIWNSHSIGCPVFLFAKLGNKFLWLPFSSLNSLKGSLGGFGSIFNSQRLKNVVSSRATNSTIHLQVFFLVSPNFQGILTLTSYDAQSALLRFRWSRGRDELSPSHHGSQPRPLQSTAHAGIPHPPSQPRGSEV